MAYCVKGYSYRLPLDKLLMMSKVHCFPNITSNLGNFWQVIPIIGTYFGNRKGSSVLTLSDNVLLEDQMAVNGDMIWNCGIEIAIHIL